ncbi:glycosyltransferase family 2 protein [Chitinophaga niabensis]|uniref:glycosyltransferase family 2 protein n=1 Tax=Chitinophaga niabensis TaxID=536979 RepID=UPI0031BAD70B
MQSLADQTYMPGEVIIVDDGSEPLKKAVLHINPAQFPFKVIIADQGMNKGAPSARNQGKSIAANEYIAFLDADDAWVKNKLAVQVKMIEDLQCDLLYTEYSESFPGEVPSSVNPDQVLHISYRDVLRKNLSPVTLLMKKDLPLKFDERLRRCDDFKLSIEALAGGFKIVKIDLPYSYGFKFAIGHAGLTKSLFKMSSSFLRACALISMEKPKLTPLMTVFALFEITKFPVRVLKTKLRNAYK